MKKIPLRNSKLFALVDDEDFAKVADYSWYAHVTKYGVVYAEGYRGGRRHVLMHRIVMNCTPRDGVEIDHVRSGDTLDNRKANLRPCTRSQNNANRRKNRSSTSRYKGVSLYKGRYWRAQIRRGGKKVRLGCFKLQEEEEAARIYDAAAIEQWGEFALTNEMMGLFKKAGVA